MAWMGEPIEMLPAVLGGSIGVPIIGWLAGGDGGGGVCLLGAGVVARIWSMTQLILS